MDGMRVLKSLILALDPTLVPDPILQDRLRLIAASNNF